LSALGRQQWVERRLAHPPELSFPLHHRQKNERIHRTDYSILVSGTSVS
jgi:hypothetical protein